MLHGWCDPKQVFKEGRKLLALGVFWISENSSLKLRIKASRVSLRCNPMLFALLWER
jgi:hypothetical protein